MADRAPRPGVASFAPVEYAAVVFAVLVAQLFLAREWSVAPDWDALQYVRLARSIEAEGLLARHDGSETRTYLYPLLLAGAGKLAAALGLPLRFVVAQAQLALYLGLALAFRAALAPLAGTLVRPVFCGLLANYYVLGYAPLTLTESVSASLTVAAATLWTLMCRDRVSTRLALALGIVAGAALAVRPANAVLVVASAAGLAVLLLRDRRSAHAAGLVVLAAAAGAAIPMVPQVVVNVRHFDHFSVFPHTDLAALQVGQGIRHLKYGTAVPPVPGARIEYENPLHRGTVVPAEQPWRWYAEYPLAGAATAALHVFAMTDQDLLFTYSRDLTPWYRVPLGVVNHAMVALGLLGLGLCAWRARRAPDLARATVALAVLLVAGAALHASAAVEMRFGLVLLLVLFPLAMHAVAWMADAAGRAPVRIAVLGVALYVAGALALSGWMRGQSPQIRAAAQQAPGGEVPR